MFRLKALLKHVGSLLRYAGVAIVVVILVILIEEHPVLIGIELIGAALYFVGKKMK